MTQIRGNEKRLPFPSERNALPTSEDDDPQRPPRNRFDSQGGSAPRSSNDFYSTTTAPLRDDPRRPSPRPRTSSAGTSTSVLDRGRPKSNASRPSSFFNPESTDDSVGQTSAECDGRGERGSGDWVEEEHLHEGGGRPSSFFGVSSSPGPESTYEDSQARREEDSPGPETERRSSFYGLEEQFPPSSSTPDCRSPSLPNGLRNFQANNDSSSNSSLSHEAPRGGVRYQTAPYAASRAASVHGMPSNDPAPAPLLDQSHLRPGVLASLLTHDKTLDLYRANAKKTNDPDIQFEFCTFVMEIVGEMEGDGGVLERGTAEQQVDSKAKQQALIAESVALLSKLANRGHVKSQYFLADCYTQGVGTTKGRRDYDKALPLFLLAGKHGHADACFRAAQCCEHGWGCKKDFSKAVIFLRRAAVLSHPGAMHRLGLAEINGELGLSKRPREGVKWLKRAAELADQVDPPQPQSLHELAILHEKGIDNVIFVDEEYAAELLARASELQYAPSAFKLGECYEYGRMGCPQDSALSIHYYNIAAQQSHREACFALTAWYLVGSPGVLPQSDTEAYLWARKAADLGLAKAEYAVGYFTEVGIGAHKDAREALDWFSKAAEHGDKRAKDRLRSANSQGTFHRPAPSSDRPLPHAPNDSGPPPPPSSYKSPPSSRRIQKKSKPEGRLARGQSVDRTRMAAPPPIRRQRSHSQPDPVEPSPYGQPQSYAPLAYGEPSTSPYGQYDIDPSAPPTQLHQVYGRPAPQQRLSSNGPGRPIQARMPMRQQVNASPVQAGNEFERAVHRDKVLQRGEAKEKEKDCVVS